MSPLRLYLRASVPIFLILCASTLSTDQLNAKHSWNVKVVTLSTSEEDRPLYAVTFYGEQRQQGSTIWCQQDSINGSMSYCHSSGDSKQCHLVIDSTANLLHSGFCIDSTNKIHDQITCHPSENYEVTVTHYSTCKILRSPIPKNEEESVSTKPADSLKKKRSAEAVTAHIAVLVALDYSVAEIMCDFDPECCFERPVPEDNICNYTRKYYTQMLNATIMAFKNIDNDALDINLYIYKIVYLYKRDVQGNLISFFASTALTFSSNGKQVIEADRSLDKVTEEFSVRSDSENYDIGVVFTGQQMSNKGKHTVTFSNQGVLCSPSKYILVEELPIFVNLYPFISGLSHAFGAPADEERECGSGLTQTPTAEFSCCALWYMYNHISESLLRESCLDRPASQLPSLDRVQLPGKWIFHRTVICFLTYQYESACESTDMSRDEWSSIDHCRNLVCRRPIAEDSYVCDVIIKDHLLPDGIDCGATRDTHCVFGKCVEKSSIIPTFSSNQQRTCVLDGTTPAITTTTVPTTKLPATTTTTATTATTTPTTTTTTATTTTTMSRTPPSTRSSTSTSFTTSTTATTYWTNTILVATTIIVCSVMVLCACVLTACLWDELSGSITDDDVKVISSNPDSYITALAHSDSEHDKDSDTGKLTRREW